MKRRPNLLERADIRILTRACKRTKPSLLCLAQLFDLLAQGRVVVLERFDLLLVKDVLYRAHQFRVFAAGLRGHC